MSDSLHKRSEQGVLPPIVYGVGVDPSVQVSSIDAVQTMHQLAFSDEAIAQTTIYLGGKNNFFVKGLQIAKEHDRRIHGSLERNYGAGSVIRVNTRLKGMDRTPEDMNRTLVHELEHVAQADRKDKNRVVGNTMIWGGALVLATAANILSKKGGVGKRTAATVFGFVAGHELGYKISPHEVQARKRANEFISTAIKKQ